MFFLHRVSVDAPMDGGELVTLFLKANSDGILVHTVRFLI